MRRRKMSASASGKSCGSTRFNSFQEAGKSPTETPPGWAVFFGGPFDEFSREFVDCVSTEARALSSNDRASSCGFWFSNHRVGSSVRPRFRSLYQSTVARPTSLASASKAIDELFRMIFSSKDIRSEEHTSELKSHSFI